MSVLEWRGGFPVVFNGTVDTSGEITDARGGVIPAGTPLRLGAHQVQLQEDGRKGPITSKWLRISDDDNMDLRVYFSQDHFDDDVHFVTLEGGNGERGVFQGPAEVKEVWLRGVGGDVDFSLTAFHRRG